MSVNGNMYLPQAVIFDWDSTLVDNWDTITLAMNVALREYGMPEWSRKEMVDNSKVTARNSFKSIFGENWEHAIGLFYDYYNKHHLRNLQILEGAADLLTLFNNHGIKMAVCSHKQGPILRREIKHLDWSRHFISIVGSQDAEKDKPDPAPVRLILRSNHLTPGAHIWFVGDMPTDMQCALRAGCAAVGVGPESAANPEYYPNLLMPNLKALLTEIRSLLS